MDNTQYVRRNKRAVAAFMWINRAQMTAIETTLNQHVWGKPDMAGAARQTLDRTRDLLPAVGAVTADVHPGAAIHVTSLLEGGTLIRLEFRVPPDVVDLAEAANMLTRSQLLSLQSAAINDDLKAACRHALERDAPELIDLPKPSE